MLTKTQMQEIQDLKLQGYTKADIIRYYEAQGRKPPSRPTISKYYDMWKKNSSKTETMKNFPGTSRRSATISTILRIPDRSTGNRSIVVSMIMFLIPRPENRC